MRILTLTKKWNGNGYGHLVVFTDKDKIRRWFLTEREYLRMQKMVDKLHTMDDLKSIMES
jgi:hypothetical protein